MHDSVIIKSSVSDCSLSFSNFEGEYFTVEVTGADRSGTVRVWGYTDQNALVELFQSMAGNWRGWDGVKTWGSIEGEFELSATSDKLGHISIQSRLTNRNNGGAETWELRAGIVIEAGSLETLKNEITNFFHRSV